VSTEPAAAQIEEERACDEFALNSLMAGVGSYSRVAGVSEENARGKRAMGILAGVYVVANLSQEKSGTHPPPSERLIRLLEKIDILPAGRFWEFAIGAVYALCPNRTELSLAYQPTLRETVLKIAERL
jgi:hypothetical protein